MNKLHLSHLIRKPTLDNNTQDIVLASDAESINAGEVGEVLANSEHKIVRCEINCEVDTKENALLVASYIKKGNILALKSELQETIGDPCLQIKTRSRCAQV